MASRGAKAYSIMERGVSEDAAAIDEEEGEVLPHTDSNHSTDRIFHESRRRRSLLALLAVGVAVVVLVSWKFTRGAPLHTAGDDETAAFDTKKSAKEKANNSHAHVADVAASAVVSLVDSRSEAQTRDVAVTKALALEGATQAEISGQDSGVAPGPVAMDSKEDSLEVSDMPGADYIGDTTATSARAQGTAVEDKKEESLQASDVPGKASALQDSDFPGAEDSKEEALVDSNVPGAAYSDGKAASLEESDFPGAEDGKGQSLAESDMPGVHDARGRQAQHKEEEEEEKVHAGVSSTPGEAVPREHSDAWTVLGAEEKLLSATTL